MNNSILVFCQVRHGVLCDIGLELLTKGRELAAQLHGSLAAVLVGEGTSALAEEVAAYGAQTIYMADDSRLKHYTTLPYARLICEVVRRIEPQILLLGATSLGRDLAPRVAAMLGAGCTADCTELRLGDYTSPEGKEYKALLYQIRPSFVGDQLTTIIAPDTRPQMATVREGVMRMERLAEPVAAELITLDTGQLLREEDFAVELLVREEQLPTNGLKQAAVVVAGGYGACNERTFARLRELAALLGAEVGGTRAAVDAGYLPHERMIGQTGLTIAPCLYLAFGISGQVQHTVGMERSGVIVAINSDPEAPICRMADHVIVGDAGEVAERMIRILKELKR